MCRTVRFTFTAALLLPLLLCACSNRQAVERAESFSAQVCSCGDAECGRRVLGEFENWFAENTPRGTQENAEAITRAYRKAQSCVAEHEGQKL